MNILVINNRTKRLNDLKKILSNNTFDILEPDKLKNKNLDIYDLIILSGGSYLPVIGNEAFYKNEIDLIKESKTPILGICLGFELIVSVFGGKLNLSKARKRGIFKLSIINNHPLFLNLPNLLVFESHKWIVKNLPRSLTPLAESENGIEIFKHKKRDIYGFQFHPSAFTSQTCGNEIFENLTKLIIK